MKTVTLENFKADKYYPRIVRAITDNPIVTMAAAGLLLGVPTGA
jgi:hypothetical protein